MSRLLLATAELKSLGPPHRDTKKDVAGGGLVHSVNVHMGGERRGGGQGHEWGHPGRDRKMRNAWEKPPFRQ